MINKELIDLRKLSWTKTRQSSGTAGSYLKSYSYSNGKKVYYKLSFFDDINGIFGYESVNEIIALRVMEQLGYSSLKYDLIHALVLIDGKEYETYLNSSYDFKLVNESKITLENFYDINKKNNESKIDFLNRYGFINEIYKMIIIDFLINNKDRHGANFEILINNKTKKMRLAPFFDQGLSFLSPTYKKEDIELYDPNKIYKANSYIGTSDLLANLNIVPKEMLPSIKLDYDHIFADLYEIIDNNYLNKCKLLLKNRWDILENLRNKK